MKKAWKWMRYSGLLLRRLTWGHVLIQDILTGIHAMVLDIVAQMWASLGSRIYDIKLLTSAFAHRDNGLYQGLND